jgi:predicted Rossmann-fold nucleotide-binding protein
MKTVACFGSGSGNPGDFAYDRMQEAGRLLATQNILVITGGYGGSGMEAPARGARGIGGSSIGYTLACRNKMPNPFLSTVFMCGNGTDATQYATRLGHLLNADGFVVDTTDTTLGTLIEFLSVVNMNQKFWQQHPKPIALLSDSLQAAAYTQCVPNEKELLAYCRNFKEPLEAIDWLIGKL